MNKRGARVVLAILLVSSLLAVPLQGFAAGPDRYVSLGDSIAVGLSAAPGRSYYALYSSHLGPSFDSVNLGVEGKTSTQLLAELKTPGSETQLAVAGARVVTISIGGNNLLGPILAGVYQAVYVASGGTIDPSQMSGPEAAAAVAAFINANPAVWQAAVADLTAKAQPGGPLYTQLQAGVRQFVIDWPQIMGAVNALAPNARVYVLTMYNPLRGDPALGRLFDSLLLPMNSTIRLTPLRYRNVKVVDANLLFAFNPGALSFNLAQWPATAASVDPHPTTLGHRLIYGGILLWDRLRPW